MKRRPLLAAAAATLLLAACAGPQIYYGQLANLDKGMSQEQVTARLKQPPLSVHTANAGGRAFEFHRFRMNNGVQADLYLLAYERNRLTYWGYVPEFRRLSDADLNAALTSVMPQIAPPK
jgi:hypothetical protein